MTKYYLDLKYLNTISSRFIRFRQIKTDEWQLRCFYCGDSKKSETKSRGHFYKKYDQMYYTCFNCGVIKLFSSVLKDIDPLLYKEYRYETFKEISNFKKQKPIKKTEMSEKKDNSVSTKLSNIIQRLDTLKSNNDAVKYCLSRKIDEYQFKKLFYIDEIRKLAFLNEKYDFLEDDKNPKLIFPLFNDKGKLSALSLRTIRGELKRYINLRILENTSYFFGSKTIDYSKTLYVVEGQIDSLFLNNSVAIVGTGFKKAELLNHSDMVYVFDNQPRNKEICKLISDYIDDGKKMVIWNEFIKEKDINEMFIAGLPVKNIVKERTFDGLRLKLEFQKWKKI